MRNPLITAIRPVSVRVSAKSVWTLVEVTDSDGRRGLGETTGPDTGALEARMRKLNISLLGKPVPERPSGPLLPAVWSDNDIRAASAVDQALWDLRAQNEGKTIAATLGEPQRRVTRLYANMNRGLTERDPIAFGRRAAEAHAAGFDAVKIAPFDAVMPDNCESSAGQALIDAGLARVAAVTEAMGPEGDVLVDCHWRFNERVAATLVERLARLHVYWLECPLPETAETLPSLRRLRHLANQSSMRLAGADEISDPVFFSEIIASGVYDVVMPDVKHLGGLAQTLRLARMIEESGALCSFHNPTGPIAHLHSVHLSALLQTSLFLEFQYGESPLFTDIVHGDPAFPIRGTATLPTLAGLGVQLNHDVFPAFAAPGIQSSVPVD